MHKPLKTLVNAAVLSVLATSAAQAGGFSLYTESTGYTIGNFAAGVAAEAKDASTGWYNPAGLALLHDEQLVVSGVGVFPAAKISGTSTYFSPAPYPDYTQSFSNLDGGVNAVVPSLHYARPLGPNTTVGFSVVAPFGLSTSWDQNSPVRYAATHTELKTFNFAPEIGTRVSENFSIGAGLDLQYATVKFNKVLGVPYLGLLVANNPSPYLFDTLSYNEGNSFGVGFHAGLMGMFNDSHTRIGVNYQSQMRHVFHGYSELTGPLAGMANIGQHTINSAASFRSDNLYSNPVSLPDVVTVSGYHDVNDKLALLGSIVFTGWSSIQTITLNNAAAPSVANNGTITLVKVDSTSPEHYKDAMRYALGANYKVNDQILVRGGVGYDATPTVDAYRDVRLPDTDRWALSIGGHYQARSNIGIDLGYTYLWSAKNKPINNTEALGATSSYNVTATAKAYASLVGAQLVWKIDQPVPAATK